MPAEARLEGIEPLPDSRGPRAGRSSARCSGACRPAASTSAPCRSGDWKLLVDGTARFLMFNVRKDLGERDDVAQQQPAVVRRLRQLLLAWEKDVDAEAKAGASAAKPMP